VKAPLVAAQALRRLSSAVLDELQRGHDAQNAQRLRLACHQQPVIGMFLVLLF
jgi:hypothetical protein